MRIRATTAAGAAFFAVAGAIAAPASAQDADTVIARVGDAEITLGHMIVLRERLPQEYQDLDDRSLWDGILEQLVQQTALAQSAGTPPRSVELTLENERRALLASSLIQQRAGEAVTEEAIRAAYEEAYGDAEPGTEYDASHILVETEEEAQALVEQLEGGADFAELARSASIGPSGPSGGALGWFGPGAMVPAFDEAVQSMEVGEIAGPVQTQFGWHVIRLNDTRNAEVPALDAVREEIVTQLQRDAVADLIDEATAQADVEMVAPDDIDPSILRQDALLDE